jgi:hypothetical protein
MTRAWSDCLKASRAVQQIGTELRELEAEPYAT